MIIRLSQLADIEEMCRVATEDQHSVIAPTHTLVKQDEIVGFLSIGAVPLVLCHLHTQKVKAIDSYKIEGFIMEECRRLKAKQVCVPCNVNSPLLPYMKRKGMTSFGVHDLFFKPLTE